MSAGPDHFGLANKLIAHGEHTSKDPGFEELIVAVRALTAATLAQAAATAELIEDADRRKKWAKVIGR
jgi:hypothetical protein